MVHLKMGYGDVMNMPTNERRFHIGLLVKNKSEEHKRMQQIQKTSGGSNGNRKKIISGEALKSQIKSGNVPLI